MSAANVRLEPLRAVHARLTPLGPEGLPTYRVLLAFPALLFIVLVILTVLGITGSSIGIYHQFFSDAADPQLLSGVPRPIRGDEWYTQTGWTISQVARGLPIINTTLPGGVDATVLVDLPSSDWSVIFRPHLVGFWFLPLDQAMAVKWWAPALTMIGAGYVFIVTLWPRRPGAAAVLSTAFFFSPFFQWWYVPISFWPIAWAFVVMAATVWLVRTKRRRVAVAWAVVVGYLTVTMGMGLYVPFIVPAAFVALFFGVGAVLQSRVELSITVKTALARVSPVFIAGVAASVILGVWLLTRLDAVQTFTNTVYPGARLQQTGDLGKKDVTALSGGVFTEALLTRQDATVLGPNAPEASTFFYIGIFLAIALLGLVIRAWRRSHRLEWMAIAVLACGALFAAFLVIPGWDAVAHLLLLDRTTVARIRIGLGLLSLVIAVVFVSRRDAEQQPAHVAWVAVTGVAAAAAVAAAWLVVRREPAVLGISWHWHLIAALFVLAVVLFASRRALLASVALLVASAIGTAGVNPVYVGMYDLKDTAVGQAVLESEKSEKSVWLGVGEWNLASSVLIHSGVTAYNGFQSMPPATMWKQIDPSGEFELQWNRLANVSWVVGDGEPVPTNPLEDQIRLNFDPCSQFAQQHVDRVLSEGQLNSSCLVQLDEIVEGPSTFWIYEVVSG